MKKLAWANFLHIYQPPGWDPAIVKKVVNESYRPILAIMKEHPPVRITMNINASLTEQLYTHGYDDVIEDIKRLASDGQLALVGSAKYHPILPLLPDEEIQRQITLNTERNREILGDVYAPVGFFPPEMCISVQLAKVLRTIGFKWLIADEVSYMGTIGDMRYDKKYSVRGVGMGIVFRHRGISDLFFSDNLKRAEDFFTFVEKDPQIDDIIITSFDGENLGHHRKGLDKMWEKIITDDRIEAVTVPELLKRTTQVEEIVPRPASWSSNVREIDDGIPYVLWHHPDNPIHHRQWELTNMTITAVQSAADSAKGQQYERIRSALDEALASDQYWWASAQPWWHVDIIFRGIDRFMSILDNIPGFEKKKMERAKEIKREIHDIVNEWQETGKPEQIKETYFAGDSRPRYLGGKKVS